MLLIKNPLIILLLLILISSCKSEDSSTDKKNKKPIPEVKAFGFRLNDFEVVRDTVEQGDTFGEIFLRNGFDYSTIYEIDKISRKKFNFRKIQINKPYTFPVSYTHLTLPTTR